MSNLFDLLTTAKVVALGGENLGDVIGIHVVGSKMTIVVDSTLEDIIETDDDPEKSSQPASPVLVPSVFDMPSRKQNVGENN